MPQINLYEFKNSGESEIIENRYDVLPLCQGREQQIDRFCLAQTLSLARQRQLRRPLTASAEINLHICRNWAVKYLQKGKD